jgi:hypothetical protein
MAPVLDGKFKNSAKTREAKIRLRTKDSICFKAVQIGS